MKTIKVGIIGGAGRIGSALVKALDADRRFEAVGICRNNVSAARVACQGLQVRVARTNDPAHLKESTRDLDVLVNCAIPLYSPSKTSAANRLLSESLTAACAGKRLIHLSSVGVYGDFIPGRRSLFDRPKPDITYGQQKLYVEDLLVTLSKKHSAACTILRVGHVYGPELPWSQNIFGLVENEEFRLPFDGQLASNAVWINNLTTGIAEVIMQQPALPVLNVTDAPQTTWRELFDMHSQASGNPTVPPLLTNDSDRRFREYKRWSETGMMARLGIETLRWIKHLPGSYLAAVPTFKALSQRASAVIGSADLDARLRAGNCKRAARAIQAEATPEIPPAFFSEPVPGPCLNYPANSPMDGLEDLRGWYNAMSGPMDTPAKGIYSETSVG